MQNLDGPNNYKIGWIAALPIERAAATAFLDDRHGTPQGFLQHPSDANSYTWGRIGEHNVVIASLPAGVHGTTSAATSALNMLASLPQIRIGLLVGICGGVGAAQQEHGYDIRLGDVVVGQPKGVAGGVIQYDLVKGKPNQEWERTGALNKPPRVLLNALASLQADHMISPSKVPDILEQGLRSNPQMARARNNIPAFVHQGFENDRLFKSAYRCIGGFNCRNCDAAELVAREKRETTDPEIHYGVIASGNTLVKDAATRDRLSSFVGPDCLCFEMEAAGLVDHFPCLVIRGVADYADSHKNDQWQRYASATAAAFAKELLAYVPAAQLHNTARAVNLLESIRGDVKEIQSATASIRGGMQSLHAELQSSYQPQLFQRLPVAKGASFDSQAQEHSPTCLSNTRVELLRQITHWAYDVRSRKSIFWLNGMAGTGKSTISRTIAQRFSDAGHLGASFFFDRGEQDQRNLSKFFPTVAADMATRQSFMATAIKNNLDADPSVISRAVPDQFNKLFLKPLSQRPTIDHPIIFVIDALDECERDEEILLLIQLFSRVQDQGSIKVFLTSRPELPPRLGFKAIEGEYEHVILHDIPQDVIGKDISTFLKHELDNIRNVFNASVPPHRHLGAHWPSLADIQKITKLAIPLFIFAATVCRFVADRRFGIPTELLKEICEFQPGDVLELDQLDATYMPVLNQLIKGLTGSRRRKVIEQFQQVVGPILVLATPLTATTLGGVLGLSKEAVDGRLDLLHSVLRVPEAIESPIRLLHLSFRDFLVAPNRRTHPFWMDETDLHADMVSKCLRVLQTHLRQDLCDLQLPGQARLSTSPDLINANLPTQLRYASLYWVLHVEKANIGLEDESNVHQFLLLHLLHWLEALSWMGQAAQAFDMISTLQSRLMANNSDQLSNLLDDAMGLVRNHISVIDLTPLQLYGSLLTFLPASSTIKKIFGAQSQWVNLLAPVQDEWNQRDQIFEGHQGGITVFAFSPNSKFLASGSEDGTVRIWSILSGQCIKVFDNCRGAAPLTFSPNGDLIAISSFLGITVWRIRTGECIRKLLPDNEGSFDSSRLMAASYDGSVNIWHLGSGQCVCELNETWTTRFRSAVALSYDGSMVALAFADGKELRVRNVNSGETLHTLTELPGNVISMTFSRDASQLVVAFFGRAARMYCMTSGNCTQSFNIVPASFDAEALTLSPDSTLLGVAMRHSGSEIYRVDTGERVQALNSHLCGNHHGQFSCDLQLKAWGSDFETILQVHRTAIEQLSAPADIHSGRVYSVAMSQDTTLLASAALDKTIRIWRCGTGECIRVLSGHTDAVLFVAFSADSKLLVSTSGGGSARIWHVDTGECLRALPVGSNTVWDASLSNDSALLATSCQDEGVKIWQVETGQCIRTISIEHSSIFPVALSNDCALVATVCAFSVLVWSLDKEEPIHKLEVPSSARSAAFLHDSEILAISLQSKTIYIVHSRTGETLHHLDVGFQAGRIFFEPSTTRLMTDYGAIDIYENTGARSSGTDPVGQFYGYGISGDECWITWRGNKLLWIPPESRRYSSVVSRNVVATGSVSGRVTIIKLPIEPSMASLPAKGVFKASATTRRTMQRCGFMS
ncbi:hypothetical protein NLG97_g4368 [Lecanicillium saksenae]|uniref:Uncharacterized protein n=1 Tax=Lecanicillium saksenae TaxID=468837 RepID=A0ACC1QVN0_9HYPO|nr:hypothetical protein NLG97_g4368 [Lecanicillium saksenae]